MTTFNDFFQKDTDTLQYFEADDNNKNKETSLSQSFNVQQPMDGLTQEHHKRIKHPRTNYDAAFVMKYDITDKEIISSLPVSNRDQSINTSKWSRRTTDYPEVLLTWDETAKRGLTKEEQ